jgi:nicotinic acid mononucleotide adenylyltransferase
MKKVIRLTENDIINLVKKVIEEQGVLYGNPTDVVDYQLPELSSDVIILTKPKNFNDVGKSLKEIHKRLKFIELALKDLEKPFSDLENREISQERDDELMKRVIKLQKQIENNPNLDT